MSRRYEKEGQSFRIELLRGERHEISAIESGRADESDAAFCATVGPRGQTTFERDAGELRAQAASLFDAVTQTARPHLERLVVVCGESVHRVTDDDGDRRSWRDETSRVHLALRHPAGLIELDLAPTTGHAAALLLEEVVRSLVASSPQREEATLRLHPLASVAISNALLFVEPLPLPLCQVPHEHDARDGVGLPIATGPLDPSAPRNRFRPSYRFAPVVLPHDVAIVPFGAGATAANEAVAVIGAVSIRGGTLRATLLLAGGGITTLTLPLSELSSRLIHASEPAVWTPRAAGIWGQDLIFDLER